MADSSNSGGGGRTTSLVLVALVAAIIGAAAAHFAPLRWVTAAGITAAAGATTACDIR
jgi:hypothetical protein